VPSRPGISKPPPNLTYLLFSLAFPVSWGVGRRTGSGSHPSLAEHSTGCLGEHSVLRADRIMRHQDGHPRLRSALRTPSEPQARFRLPQDLLPSPVRGWRRPVPVRPGPGARPGISDPEGKFATDSISPHGMVREFSEDGRARRRQDPPGVGEPREAHLYNLLVPLADAWGDEEDLVAGALPWYNPVLLSTKEGPDA